MIRRVMFILVYKVPCLLVKWFWCSWIGHDFKWGNRGYRYCDTCTSDHPNVYDLRIAYAKGMMETQSQIEEG